MIPHGVEIFMALQLEVELMRRRLVVAKAERVDTTQLELERELGPIAVPESTTSAT